MTIEWKRTAVAAVVSVLGIGAMCSADTVMYVDASASGGGDGGTWEGAYRFLADAIQAAVDSGGPVELHVAGGSYFPDRSEAAPEGTGDRYATFRLMSGVRVLGGYAGLAGGGEGNTRDPDVHVTVLSGDLAGDDLPGFVNNGENSYHVVTASGADATAVLDGLTITAGNADGDLNAACFGGTRHGSPCEIENECPFGLCVSPDSTGAGLIAVSGGGSLFNCRVVDNFAKFQGAGMMLKAGSDLLVSHSTFSGNRALDNGGALYMGQSSPVFLRCAFIANQGGRYAGASCNRDHSDAQFIDCLFQANTAAETTETGGGAIVNASSSPTFTRCTFVGNDAISGKGGAVYNKLGFHPELGPSRAQIIACSFEGNTALVNGGALYDEEGSETTVSGSNWTGNSAELGGAIYTATGSTTEVEASIFTGNHAVRGGAVYSAAAAGTILESSTFDSNTVIEMGGAIFGNGGLDIATCSVRYNTADERGGGIYNDSGNVRVEGGTVEFNVADSYGGGVYADGSLEATGVHFEGNQGRTGGGVYSPGGSNDDIIFMTDCTFHANFANYGAGAYGAGEVTDCVFTNNVAGAYGGGFYGNNGGQEIDVTDCTFENNQADRGGGMYAGPSFGQAVTVTNTVFYDNAALSHNGGGLQVTNSPITLTDLDFEGNSSAARGGGLSINGSIATIRNVRLVDNSAVTNGGGVRIADGAETDVRNMLVQGNSSSTGGGIYLNGADAVVVDSRILGNVATTWGGGMYAAFSDFTMINVAVSGNFAADRGGAFHLFRCNPTIVNSALVHNIAAIWGGGIFNQNDVNISMSNSILWANQDSLGEVEASQITNYIDSETVVDHSCVQGWTGTLPGDETIGDDPLMVNPRGADNTSGTIDDDLRLGAGSPCIDTGFNPAVPVEIETDLDGNKRIVDGPDPADRTAPRVDMGPYETPPDNGCVEDVDGDGQAGFADVLRILAHWGETGGREDVDGDGTVGFGDVLTVLARWGPC